MGGGCLVLAEALGCGDIVEWVRGGVLPAAGSRAAGGGRCPGTPPCSSRVHRRQSSLPRYSTTPTTRQVHWRFTHNRDIVPSVPPGYMGFYHLSREVGSRGCGQGRMPAGQQLHLGPSGRQRVLGRLLPPSAPWTCLPTRHRSLPSRSGSWPCSWPDERPALAQPPRCCPTPPPHSHQSIVFVATPQAGLAAGPVLGAHAGGRVRRQRRGHGLPQLHVPPGAVLLGCARGWVPAVPAAAGAAAAAADADADADASGRAPGRACGADAGQQTQTQTCGACLPTRRLASPPLAVADHLLYLSEMYAPRPYGC